MAFCRLLLEPWVQLNYQKETKTWLSVTKRSCRVPCIRVQDIHQIKKGLFLCSAFKRHYHISKVSLSVNTYYLKEPRFMKIFRGDHPGIFPIFSIGLGPMPFQPLRGYSLLGFRACTHDQKWWVRSYSICFWHPGIKGEEWNSATYNPLSTNLWSARSLRIYAKFKPFSCARWRVSLSAISS